MHHSFALVKTKPEENLGSFNLFCRLYAESKVVNARPARVNTGTLKRRVTSRALFPDSFATHWLQRVFTTTTERRGFKIVLLCKNQFT